jgi:hypothetical protein
VLKRLLGTFLLGAVIACADGHGPAFGFGTAVLGAGDTSVETQYMWRDGVSMLGPQITYGLTGNTQISVSAPFHLDHGEHPDGRFTAMMPGNPEVEVLAAWRFHHRLTGVGTRWESTLYMGTSISTQLPPRSDGPPLGRAPGFYLGAATGHISRKYYVWSGAGYEHYASTSVDHQSDSLLGSLVFGWRPPFWDMDYPKPDLRVFWESTGEWIGYASRSTPVTSITLHSHDVPDPEAVLGSLALTSDTASLPTREPPNPLPNPSGNDNLPNSGGKAVYSGPTVLLTMHGMAFQGGILFAVWRDPNGTQPADKIRAIVGVTYFFLKGRK